MATNEIQNGCESSIEAVLASNHKRRCVLGARDRPASVRENCLPVIASAQPKPTPFRRCPYRFNRENSKLFPCQITPYPTRQFPRNNGPLNLPRSHEKPRRGTPWVRQFRAMCPEGATYSGAPYRIEIIRARLFTLAPLSGRIFAWRGT